VKPFLIGIAALLLAWVAYGFSQAFTPEADARLHDRNLIDACHEQHDRESLSPGAARNVATICENLENEYRTKWNREP
jgi:hypothetical protein